MEKCCKKEVESVFKEIEELLNRKATPTKHTEHHIRYKKLVISLRKLVENGRTN